MRATVSVFLPLYMHLHVQRFKGASNLNTKCAACYCFALICPRKRKICRQLASQDVGSLQGVVVACVLRWGVRQEEVRLVLEFCPGGDLWNALQAADDHLESDLCWSRKYVQCGCAVAHQTSMHDTDTMRIIPMLLLLSLEIISAILAIFRPLPALGPECD